MVLRLVTEEVTWTNDSNAGAEVQKWRREMLASMFTTLDTVLPFLHTAVEASFGRAMEAAAARDAQSSKAHAAVVTAALGEHNLPPHHDDWKENHGLSETSLQTPIQTGGKIRIASTSISIDTL